jgi:hypothetical protein
MAALNWSGKVKYGELFESRDLQSPGSYGGAADSGRALYQKESQTPAGGGSTQKMFCKLAIDLVMTALMLLVMAHPVMGNTIHELVGVSIFILFIAHNILNRSWYQTVLNGKNDIFRVFNATVNLLLLVTMLMLIVSGVFISRTVFDFIPVKGSLIMRQIHVFCAYWGFVFMSVHLGLHWEMIIAAVRKMTGTTSINLVRTIVLRVIAVLIVLFGVQASFDRNIGSKLILYYTYDFWNSDDPVISIFISYLTIMGIYVCATYYFLKFVQKINKAKPFYFLPSTKK